MTATLVALGRCHPSCLKLGRHAFLRLDVQGEPHCAFSCLLSRPCAPLCAWRHFVCLARRFLPVAADLTYRKRLLQSCHCPVLSSAQSKSHSAWLIIGDCWFVRRHIRAAVSSVDLTVKYLEFFSVCVQIVSGVCAITTYSLLLMVRCCLVSVVPWHLAAFC